MIPVKGRGPHSCGLSVQQWQTPKTLKKQNILSSVLERSAQFNLLFLIEEKNAPPK
jgi:hypothetical protein